MLDQVPLRGTGRVMHHRDDQTELVGQPLQGDLPGPLAKAVGAAAIRLDEQAFRAGIKAAPHLQPPPADRRDGEGRRLVRGADDDI